MSKPNRKRLKLAEVRQKRADEVGAAVEFETDDGEVFSVPTPDFWEDEVRDHLNEGDARGAAVALLGAQEYARLREHGGRANDVALVIAAYAEEQGVSLGE